MRGFRRMTQEELGREVGVSKQTISNWEHDYRTPDAEGIRGICLALGCTSDYVLGLAEDPNSNVRW